MDADTAIGVTRSNTNHWFPLIIFLRENRSIITPINGAVKNNKMVVAIMTIPSSFSPLACLQATKRLLNLRYPFQLMQRDLPLVRRLRFDSSKARSTYYNPFVFISTILQPSGSSIVMPNSFQYRFSGSTSPYPSLFNRSATCLISSYSGT